MTTAPAIGLVDGITRSVASPETGVTIAILALAAFAGYRFFRLSGAIAEGRAQDERTVDDLTRGILLGQFPEARDRARQASGPLGKALFEVLRFPYGVHRDAIARVIEEVLVKEKARVRACGRPITIAAGILLFLGAVALAGAGGLFPAGARTAVLGFAAGASAVGFWIRITLRARESSRYVEARAREVARLIVSFTESPEVAGPAETPEQEPEMALVRVHRVKIEVR